MQNATSMTVTLSDGEHEVLFSATSCDPGKQLDSWHNYWHETVLTRTGESGRELEEAFSSSSFPLPPTPIPGLGAAYVDENIVHQVDVRVQFIFDHDLSSATSFQDDISRASRWTTDV